MRVWRAMAAFVLFAVAAGALFAGPEGLRFVLFWAFFIAAPGTIALRLADVRAGWAYLIAGAVSGSLGLIGAAYPIPPSFTGVWVPAFTGAIFGLGWKFLLWLKFERRGEVSPIQRTVSWWNG